MFNRYFLWFVEFINSFIFNINNNFYILENQYCSETDNLVLI